MYLTLSQLKDWLLPESLRAGYQFDAMIAAIGDGVAGSFDSYCNRTIGYTVGKVDTFRANIDAWVTSCYPLVEVTTVEYRRQSSEDYTSLTASTIMYSWDPPSGTIRLVYQLGTSGGQTRITHTGGYWYYTAAYPTLPAGATVLPNDLLLAYRLQVEKVWKNKDRLGWSVAVVRHPEADYLYDNSLDPEVKEILKLHRRQQIL